MVCKSCFQRVFCKSDIYLGRSICSFVLNSDCGLIYNRFGDTFVRQWAQYFIVFRATTHVNATGRAGNCRQRGFVVSIDSLLDVWHTAVANLDCITVE
jgi:hypothetical protein